MVSSVMEKFTSMEYGPAPEDASEVASWLEAQIDRVNAALSPLSSFVLPGGSVLAAHLHLARTIVRRAERDAVAAAASPAVLRYLNRLSDLLFVLARHANAEGRTDVLWTPGAHRGGE